MSEFWKSTPKYWCKFCKVYVRDTKLQRQQHEATGRHQGSVQRGIKDIHRANDQEEREKKRAKDEVTRLNGVMSGGAGNPGGTKLPPPPPPPPKQQASLEDRKRQMAQLSAMGIVIPDEFRKDLAITGEWKAISQTPVVTKPKKEDMKPETIAVGIRKRKKDGKEEEEEEGAKKPRKGWGSSFKTYPGSESAADDVEALLGGPIKLKNESADPEIKSKPEEDPVKTEEPTDDEAPLVVTDEPEREPHIKTEDSLRPDFPPVKVEHIDTAPTHPAAGIVFKKRKAKPLKEK